MKTLLLILPIVALSACQKPLEIAQDDPRRAAADARIAGTVFGASGISGMAYVGASSRPDGANLSYDKNFTNAVELAAAPANVCASLNGTVDTVRDEPDPSGLLDDNFRVLYISCNA